MLGPDHLNALMPDVLAGCSGRNSNVREGHLTLFQFLPLTMEETFQV